MSDSLWPHRRQPTRLSIPGILQARTLEWVAISFSNAWKWKVKVKSLSHVQLLATPWTAAYQAPLSMGFSRQEYWSGVPLPSPRGRKAWCLFKEYWVFLFCWESLCLWVHCDVIWLPSNVKLHLSSLRTSWRAPKCMQCPKRSLLPKRQTHSCLARWAKLLCGRFIWNFPLCMSSVVPVACASASDPILLKII